jgi:CheY-like chemotaxis protein
MEILLVEDDADLARMLKAAFPQELGCRVAWATDGREALLYLSSAAQLPRIVILDMLLPTVTGWSVLERMRSDPVLKMVPVVVLTGSGDPPDRAPPVAAYLKKPFNPDDLIAIVGKVLQKPPTFGGCA